MNIFAAISLFIWYVVASVIALIALLMLLRFIITVADLNPFGFIALNIRKLSDPIVQPMRRMLVRFGIDPNIAPLITILVWVLFGWFAVRLADTILFSISGILTSVRYGMPLRLLGHILYAMLAIYMLMIFMRIVLGWGMSPISRLMRFLIRVTEPVLGPFRRIIPPLGVFDISPIIVLFLLQLFMGAVEGTLLAGPMLAR